MKARDYYDQLITSMPFGAERIVLRVLSFRVGLKHAIQKADLIIECAKAGIVFKDERQVRKTIVDLRKRGIPICSSSGESGYYLAANLAEYREFVGREYIKKITDMRETVKAMNDSIRIMFPGEYAQYQADKADAAGQPQLL
ncbi:MAG: hypothetical protein QMD04_10680 [Anaerolineales bacterium]|nr:hypothetical protein [Anaerolineales bacterium]